MSGLQKNHQYENIAKAKRWNNLTARFCLPRLISKPRQSPESFCNLYDDLYHNSASHPNRIEHLGQYFKEKIRGILPFFHSDKEPSKSEIRELKALNNQLIDRLEKMLYILSPSFINQIERLKSNPSLYCQLSIKTDNKQIVELDDSILKCETNFNNNNNNSCWDSDLKYCDDSSSDQPSLKVESSCNLRKLAKKLEDDTKVKRNFIRYRVNKRRRRFLKCKRMYRKKESPRKPCPSNESLKINQPVSEKIRKFDKFFFEKATARNNSQIADRIKSDKIDQSFCETKRQNTQKTSIFFGSDPRSFSAQINSTFSKKLKSLGEFISENPNFDKTLNQENLKSSNCNHKVKTTPMPEKSFDSVYRISRQFLRISKSFKTLNEAEKLDSKGKREPFSSHTKLDISSNFPINSDHKNENQVSREIYNFVNEFCQDMRRLGIQFQTLFVSPLDSELKPYEDILKEKYLLEKYLFQLDWNFGSSEFLLRNQGYLALQNRYHLVRFVLEHLKLKKKCF
jgi:hypothetical protein